jgi:Fic family protein
LELDTINEANRWLRGIALEESEEQCNQATTVEEGLKEYISLLENKVPKQISAQNLRNFIADHHWPTDCWGFEQRE